MDDLAGILAEKYAFRPQSNPSSILEDFQNLGTNTSPSEASMPVFDKPLYDDVEDDDIFVGIPGVRSSSSAAAEAFDVFESISPSYDDLLENLGRGIPANSTEAGAKRSAEMEASEFDELIPGFGGSSPTKGRESPEIDQPHFTASSANPTVNMAEDPFIVLESTYTSGSSSSGLYNDPLEHLSGAMNSGSTKVDTSSASGGIFYETDSFGGLPNSKPTSNNEINKNIREKSPSNDTQNINTEHQFIREEPFHRSSPDVFSDILPKVQPSKSNTEKSLRKNGFHSSEMYGINVMGDQSPTFNRHFEKADDVWLTVSEIPLSTQPTSAPPPSRPPPPLVIKQTSFDANGEPKDNEFYSQSAHRYYNGKESMRNSVVSPIDHLDDFAMGKPQMYGQDHADSISNEGEFDSNLAAAAAMKEAMDRAEAKFKHAKEVREKEAKSREYMQQQEQDERTKVDDYDFEDRENQERLDKEREHREQEEREKEQKRLQRERELELERERGRQAVERATREARERAAIEARQKAERAAVQKVAAEARQRAERAAVQRAAAEARERAAAEARERAAAEAREKAARERTLAEAQERAAADARERAAAEAREKAARERTLAEAQERAAADARERAAAEAREKAARERASAEARERAEREKSERAAVERAATEARIRAERAAVEKVAAEARERAAAAARERAAAAARERQQKPDDDLESFFGMGSRATSAPKTRSTTAESMFNSQTQNKGSSDGPRSASSNSSSSIRKASSVTNIADDLSAIFGGPPSSGDFQEIEGETEERRRARLERHQRTLERAAKALAEKNERDMQTQRDQAERHRIGETLDFEIKRWAAGKEGNLRALLSTLQYVLWPECGWQPVSLTDLITAAAVKKVYRKATLCIHPDKVQQKGATLQHKYIAEKVFDLLKEAWNKFNSEELF